MRGKEYTNCADYIYSFHRVNAYRTTFEACEIALQNSYTVLRPKVRKPGIFHLCHIFIKRSVNRYSFES